MNSEKSRHALQFKENFLCPSKAKKENFLNERGREGEIDGGRESPVSLEGVIKGGSGERRAGIQRVCLG